MMKGPAMCKENGSLPELATLTNTNKNSFIIIVKQVSHVSCHSVTAKFVKFMSFFQLRKLIFSHQACFFPVH